MAIDKIETLVGLLSKRSIAVPDQHLYTFYSDHSDTSLTLGRLQAQAHRVAARVANYAAAGERVILLYPAGLDFITALFGCFCANVIAVPIYSHNLQIQKLCAWLTTVANDTDATLVLTTAAIANEKKRFTELAPGLDKLTFMATDTFSTDTIANWTQKEINPDSVAFLQYSSGSTGTPKGVMVSHHNLMSNLEIIRDSFGLTPGQGVVCWLPHYHDMGLIGNILGSMFSQATLHMFSPIDFVRKPLRWLQLISRTKSAVSGGPNFAYDLCCQHITPEQAEGLDLSCWEVAYNGAEMVRESTLSRFKTVFAPYGFNAKAFHPCYGLAEATLVVTSSEKEVHPRELVIDRVALQKGETIKTNREDASTKLISSGRLQASQEVVIVNPETKQHCVVGKVGEIWVRGPSICKGYWNRPNETEATLSAKLTDDAGGGFLRTGDLGFLDEGWLYVTGRIKDLIIIRGQNHASEDIETTVIESHPLLAQSRSVAFSVESDGQENLVIVVTKPKRLDDHQEEFVAAIRKSVSAKHDLVIKELVFIKRNTIPLTSSGKVRRHECKRCFTEGSLTIVYQAGQRPIEKAENVIVNVVKQSHHELRELPADVRFAMVLNHLQKILSQELQLPMEQISITASLNMLSVDSLSKVRIQHDIQNITGIQLTAERLLSEVTLIQLAREIADDMINVVQLDEQGLIEVVEQIEHPLSRGQQSLFFLNKLMTEHSAYIISRAVKVVSTLDVKALEAAFNYLVDCHPALRTRFNEKDGVPLQTVCSRDQCESAVEVIDAQEWSELEVSDYLKHAAHRSFDLRSGVMARLSILQRRYDHLLLLSVHHIIADLSSLTIIFTELCDYYSAVTTGQVLSLPLPNVNPFEYICHEEQLMKTERAQAMRDYWLAELGGHIESLDLPSDYLRPARKSYCGAVYSARLPTDLSQRIQAFAVDKGVTLYVVLMSAYFILLRRYTGKSSIVVGSPMANRVTARFANLISYLVNPVAIRVDFRDGMNVNDIIEHVNAKTLAASANQAYPFANIVEDLNIKRDISTTPLFQAMFSYLSPMMGNQLGAFALGQSGTALIYKALSLEPLAIEAQGSQFDLNMSVAVIQDAIASNWEYSTDLFKLETIVRMSQHYQSILTEMVSNNQNQIDKLNVLSAEELHLVVKEWNNTDCHYDLEQPLHRLFEQQVVSTPHLTAVVDEDKSLSYEELNIRINQLAHHLCSRGVGPGSIVAVCLERSVEMVVALYAILKAGGAYLPIDLHYPKKQIEWVIEDARPTVILTQPVSSILSYDHQCAVIVLERDGKEFDDMPGDNPVVSIDPENTAYVIYTSGSTGKPKGVMVPHRGIRNRILWMQDEYQLTPDDRVLQKTPYTFDVSVWEFFWPLSVGATLIMSRPEGHKDTAYLVDLIQKQHITTIHFVPSMLKYFLEHNKVIECQSLKRVFCSGEALLPEAAKLCLKLLSADLYNLYGPTEASIDVTSFKCFRNESFTRVLIGKPITNTQLYILNSFMQPVPIGVPGELYIGGVGLAKGYLNSPEQTSLRFVTNPFSTDEHAILYKTGDLCRYLSDGNIEYLGRIDNQVKIRGYRIELEEVESALCTHPQVTSAVAAALRDPSGSTKLVAYILPISSEMPTARELRHYLSERLPEHMLPSVYQQLSHLPLLASGKVDRKSLPEISVNLCMDVARVYHPAVTTAEKMLCSVYADILAVESVGITDNFFDLGGDSLLVLRAVAKIRELGVEVTIQQLYTNAVVAQVAALIEKNNTVEHDSLELKPFSLVSPEDLGRLPNNLTDAYPLSKMQEGLMFHSEFSPDYETYVMGMHVSLGFNDDCIQGALALLVQRHPLLRTSFNHLDYSESLQFVHPNATIPVTIIDIQHLSSDQQESEIDRYMREEKWRKFDWSQAPFFRMTVHRRSDTSNQFTFCHPLFDGWSVGLLITEFFTVYGSLVKGHEPMLNPTPRITYRDFVALELQTIASEASLRYWREILAESERSELPRWPANRRSGAGAHVRVTVKVDASTLTGLQQLASTAAVPLKSVLLAAHMRVVALLTGRHHVTTGLLVNGRPEKSEADRVIGMFLNTVPFCVNLQGGNWISLVKDIFASECSLLPHRRFPLAELVRTFGDGGQLFETAFNYIHFHIYKTLENVPGLSVLGWKSPSDQTYFPLTAYFHLDISQASNELLFFLDVDTGVLEQKQIDALQNYYLNTLNAMASDFYAQYNTATLLTEEERHLILNDWNQTGVIPLQQAPFIHQRFSEQARRYGDKVAVRCCHQDITYAELERRSNCLAHYLRELGVGPNVLVAIFLDRTTDLIISLLGVMKAGGAYVPLDPIYPKERLDFMLRDSSAHVVLTDTSVRSHLPETVVQTICLDLEWPAILARPDVYAEAGLTCEDLAYVIYTSGSTGQPKGVEIPHRALGNLIGALETTLNWTSSDVMLAVTTISFDIAGLELYLPLSSGAEVHLASRETCIDGEKLAALLADTRITTMQATPAMWRMLISTGWMGRAGLNVLCGGERLSQDLAKELLDRGCRLWNLYGPTETTIWSMIMEVTTADTLIPIGRPINHTSIYVLDAFKQPVPAGVAGELYIGGRGLARGYRNQPALTMEKFNHDPFSVDPHALLYRTGDLVRFNPDGVVEYLNRLDQQVKVRGFRVELGEIETMLCQIDGIDKAVTKIVSDAFGENYIAAYIVGNSDKRYSSAKLRAALLQKMPAYMVPSSFTYLSDYPLMQNGKIDYKSLPQPEEMRTLQSHTYVAPRSELEQKIADIYSNVLHVEQIGMDDNFFDMGGHSLLLVRVHLQLQELLKQKIAITKLFEYPTIRKVAALFADQVDRLASNRASHRVVSRKEWVSKQRDRRIIINNNTAEKASAKVKGNE